MLAVDADDALHRVIVDARLMQATRRCLLLWHRLQEHGGIHDSHAERLLAREKAAWDAEHERRRVDGAAAAAGADAQPRPRRGAGRRPRPRRAPPHSPDEAWIETVALPELQRMPAHQRPHVRATTSNKQAYIKDLNAGTYRQLVEAAESCQVAIIHPGKPRNPERARPRRAAGAREAVPVAARRVRCGKARSRSRGLARISGAHGFPRARRWRSIAARNAGGNGACRRGAPNDNELRAAGAESNLGGGCLKPTDIAHPDYFHKVVDCQWACPAHTPVPEYIRLIAAGPLRRRLHGQLGVERVPRHPRPHLRPPCEPACRRGRVEESTRRQARAGRDLPAEARRRRLQGRHPRAPAASAPTQKNGKRIACVGAGPASLTVARDLAPLGYDVIVFDGDAQAGGMIRTQIPRFRLPEAVIDEEVGYILDLGVEFRGGAAHRQSMKALLGGGLRRGLRRHRRAARPRPRHPRPHGSRGEHPHRHRLARPACPSATSTHDRQARDRARRRQHRDGLLPHARGASAART